MSGLILRENWTSGLGVSAFCLGRVLVQMFHQKGKGLQFFSKPKFCHLFVMNEVLFDDIVVIHFVKIQRLEEKTPGFVAWESCLKGSTYLQPMVFPVYSRSQGFGKTPVLSAKGGKIWEMHTFRIRMKDAHQRLPLNWDRRSCWAMIMIHEKIYTLKIKRGRSRLPEWCPPKRLPSKVYSVHSPQNANFGCVLPWKGMIISNGVFQSPRCRVFNLVREMNAVTAFSGRVAGACHLPCLAGHFWAPHLRSYVSERFEVLRQGKKLSFTSKMLGDTIGIRGFLLCSQAFWPRKSLSFFVWARIPCAFEDDADFPQLFWTLPDARLDPNLCWGSLTRMSLWHFNL